MIGRTSMRTARFLLFFLLVFGAMLYWQSDNTFCQERGKHAFIAPCAALSLLCATLDLTAAGLLGYGRRKLLEKSLRRWNWVLALISAGMVLLGAYALPVLVYGSYGLFGMRCLITEGYGISFQSLVSPLLGLLTFLCSLLEPELQARLAKRSSSNPA